MQSPREECQRTFESSKLRDREFTTMSGIPLDPVYGPDAEGEHAEFPGVYPYTRGPYASTYRSKLWTMRMFAGFGTADDTNWRFKEFIKAGGDDLSTAFDLPTLLGIDSDPPMSQVGRRGVAIDSLADMEDLYAGSDLSQITTSMTINSPAAVILAMFIAQAEKAGVPRVLLGGTLQTDILKEYQAQREFVFPPRPSMRLVRDTIVFTAAEMPRWHSVSISGYHIREAGSTAAEELAFTLANRFGYVELAVQSGLPVDAFAPRLSYFFNAHIDFFEEIAKYRAARRIWARWTNERYGAILERSMQLRDEMERRAEKIVAHLDDLGDGSMLEGCLRGIANNWFKVRIADSAYELERAFNKGAARSSASAGSARATTRPRSTCSRSRPRTRAGSSIGSRRCATTATPRAVFLLVVLRPDEPIDGKGNRARRHNPRDVQL